MQDRSIRPPPRYHAGGGASLLPCLPTSSKRHGTRPARGRARPVAACHVAAACAAAPMLMCSSSSASSAVLCTSRFAAALTAQRLRVAPSELDCCTLRAATSAAIRVRQAAEDGANGVGLLMAPAQAATTLGALKELITRGATASGSAAAWLDAAVLCTLHARRDTGPLIKAARSTADDSAPAVLKLAGWPSAAARPSS